MSIDNASIEEFRRARMLEIRKLFGKHERDTATPAVTACAMNENVVHIVAHLRKHPTDISAIINLKRVSAKRRKYMMYLKNIDYNTYAYILKYYGLKDFASINQKNDPHLIHANRYNH